MGFWRVALVLFLAGPLIVLWLGRTEKPGDGPPARPPAAIRESPDALERARNNAEASPGHDTLLELGLQYYRKRQFRESIAATERALEFNPGSAVAYSNLCAAYCELGMWDQAVEAGRKALSIDPAFELAKNNLGWALREKAKSAFSPAPQTR